MGSLQPKTPDVKKLVIYRRCSTQRQGDSGLGLQAQLDAVNEYAKRYGAEVVATFTEVESGKKSDRPELKKALDLAKKLKASVCVAKLDRLSRNAHFLLTILESGANVVFADLPQLDGPMGRFIVTQMAAIAELEAGMIAARTKAALAAAKARGTLLGSARPGHWLGNEKRRLELLESGRQAQRKASADAYQEIRPLIVKLRVEGKTLREIADCLNADGHTTRNGAQWKAMQVKRILEQNPCSKLAHSSLSTEDRT